MKRILLILTLFCFAATTAAQQPQNREQLENKLVLDMFFAGELADRIIDSGKYADILHVSGVQDRSELRTKLIFWIRENPKQAADFYYSLPSGKGGQAPPPLPMSWRVKERFANMVAQLKKTADDSSMSDEGLAFYSRRIFEGEINNDSSMEPSAATGTRFFSGGHTAPAVAVAAADWKINPAALTREKTSAEDMLARLNKDLETDKIAVSKLLQGELAETAGTNKKFPLDPGEVEKSLAVREQFISDAETSRLAFTNYATRFSGSLMTNRESALRLEQHRSAMRAAMVFAYIQSRIFKVQVVTAKNAYIFPRPLEQSVSKEASEIQSLYLDLKTGIKTGISVPEIYRLLMHAEKAEYLWRKKLAVAAAATSIKKAAAALYPETLVEIKLRQKFGKTELDLLLTQLAAITTKADDALAIIADSNIDESTLRTLNSYGFGEQNLLTETNKLAARVCAIRLSYELLRFTFIDGIGGRSAEEFIRVFKPKPIR